MITTHELTQIAAADPYMAGYAAQAAGQARTGTNPAWLAGFDDAEKDDREGVKIRRELPETSPARWSAQKSLF